MIPNFISKEENGFCSNFIKSWRDLIFPPLCVHCKEKCETKLFCPSCWELCAPPDVSEKCPHCFEDSEGLCSRCKRKPLLPFPRAYVFEDQLLARHLEKADPEMVSAFAMVQWSRLGWPAPDVIVPMPGSRELAASLSSRLLRPMANILHNTDKWRCDAEAISEDQIILLVDGGNPLYKLQGAIQVLGSVYPKRGYVFSIWADKSLS